MAFDVELLRVVNSGTGKMRNSQAFFADGRRVPQDELISPSSLKSFSKDCERAWGFGKLDGIRKPSTPGQQLGSDAHDSLEKWLLHNDMPPRQHDFLVPALKHFPLPKSSGLEVESYFALRFEDVVFHGYMDVFRITPAGVTVFDLKTTKDLCWALTPVNLSQDIQANVYAVMAMLRASVDSVTTRWVYAVTERRTEALPVEVQWQRDFALSQLAEWLPDARRMVAYMKNKKEKQEGQLQALDLTPNYGSCGAYGGCYYLPQCRVTAKQGLVARWKQEKTEKEKREEIAPYRPSTQAKTKKTLVVLNTQNETTQEAEMTASPALEKARAQLAARKGKEAPALGETIAVQAQPVNAEAAPESKPFAELDEGEKNTLRQKMEQKAKGSWRSSPAVAAATGAASAAPKKTLREFAPEAEEQQVAVEAEAKPYVVASDPVVEAPNAEEAPAKRGPGRPKGSGSPKRAERTDADNERFTLLLNVSVFGLKGVRDISTYIASFPNEQAAVDALSNDPPSGTYYVNPDEISANVVMALQAAADVVYSPSIYGRRF